MDEGSSNGKWTAPKLSTNELNYSIKLSFVFAFSESELRQVIEEEDDIVKDIDPRVRSHRRQDVQPPRIWESTELAEFAALGSAELPGRQYNSWGIIKDLPHSTSSENPKGRRTLWPYTTEPQQILAHKVKSSEPGASLRIRHYKAHPLRVVNHRTDWLLAVDSSVSGFPPGIIPTQMSGAGSKVRWDSFGLRLLSPIFQTGSRKEVQEICQMLRAVSSRDSTTAAVVTNYCGLHVQVGCPDDINFLQALATILLIFETQISHLHHPWRRPGHIAARDNIESNRLGLIADDGSTFSRLKSKYQSFSCGDAGFKGTLTVMELRQRIAAQTDPRELVRMLNWPSSETYGYELGNRDRQVDFTTAIKENGSRRYIDFRSARSSLCETHVSWWINFCVRLVRLATFYSKSPEQFPVQNWDQVQSMGKGKTGGPLNAFALLELMGMTREEMQYWEHKSAAFMAGKIPQCDCTEMTGCKSVSTRKRGRSDADINDPGVVSQRRRLDDATGPKVSENKRRSSNEYASSNSVKSKEPAILTFKVPDTKTASNEIQKSVLPTSTLPIESPATIAWLQSAQLNLDEQTAAALAQRLNGTVVSNRTGFGVRFQEGPQISPSFVHNYASHGVLSSANSLIYDSFGWRLMDFTMSHWASVSTRSTLTFERRSRRNVCGIHAIIESLRHQYPEVPLPAPTDLLRIGDRLAPTMINPTPEVHNADDELVDAILNEWGNGQYVLVVVLADARVPQARRIGSETRRGRDLYLYHIQPRSPTGAGHWEGMRRRTAAEFDGQSGVRRSARGSVKNKM